MHTFLSYGTFWGSPFGCAGIYRRVRSFKVYRGLKTLVNFSTEIVNYSSTPEELKFLQCDVKRRRKNLLLCPVLMKVNLMFTLFSSIKLPS